MQMQELCIRAAVTHVIVVLLQALFQVRLRQRVPAVQTCVSGQ